MSGQVGRQTLRLCRLTSGRSTDLPAEGVAEETLLLAAKLRDGQIVKAEIQWLGGNSAARKR